VGSQLRQCTAIKTHMFVAWTAPGEDGVRPLEDSRGSGQTGSLTSLPGNSFCLSLAAPLGLTGATSRAGHVATSAIYS
jgi:hypothetical protein